MRSPTLRQLFLFENKILDPLILASVLQATLLQERGHEKKKLKRYYPISQRARMFQRVLRNMPQGLVVQRTCTSEFRIGTDLPTTSFLQRWRSWAISNSWLSFSRLEGSPRRQWICITTEAFARLIWRKRFEKYREISVIGLSSVNDSNLLSENAFAVD